MTGSNIILTVKPFWHQIEPTINQYNSDRSLDERRQNYGRSHQLLQLKESSIPGSMLNCTPRNKPNRSSIASLTQLWDQRPIALLKPQSLAQQPPIAWAIAASLLKTPNPSVILLFLSL
ncbi:hypothetical protein [Oculatella sp. LEGE 06141]|uniref:hypothetical protein n=1 Tax=Oculatella sp. LEGE 06141 TaxID=1828648 RepID=UPI001D15A139|nr:hypothetical protein [Oculatella sp. LEGE 06141]